MSQPRPIDRATDLPAVVNLLSRTRSSGGLSHPGGIQWWLRGLWDVTRNDFEAFVWGDADHLDGFALIDGTFVVTEADDGSGPTIDERLDFLEGHMRATGRATLMLHLAEQDPNVRLLAERGYQATGSELELMADLTDEPQTSELPDGFRFTSLLEVDDTRYIEGHVAAWSDTKPSTYRRELHDAVKHMPTFHADLVTIALAPDGTVASYCMGWLDERSQTLEIEPLGTHRDYRRKRLAHAVVKEVQHRAWANGAKDVLVWNDPSALPKANGLYVGADMSANRSLVELSKQL